MSSDEESRQFRPDRVVSGGETGRDVAQVVSGDGDSVRRLREAGIETAQGLILRCARPCDRAAVSAETGIAAGHLVAWTSIAELLRISGVTPDFAVMLEAVGAGSLAALREREADRLADAMLALTAERSIKGLIPSAAVVGGWIRQARRLKPVVTESDVSNPSTRTE